MLAMREGQNREQMEKGMEQQERTEVIRNNENEREMEREWLALRSGILSA